MHVKIKINPLGQKTLQTNPHLFKLCLNWHFYQAGRNIWTERFFIQCRKNFPPDVQPARQNCHYSWSVCMVSDSLWNPWNCLSHFIKYLFTTIYYNLFKWWDFSFGFFIHSSFDLFTCSETLIWIKCLSRTQINSISHSLYVNNRGKKEWRLAENCRKQSYSRLPNSNSNSNSNLEGKLKKRFKLSRVWIYWR